MSYNNRFPSLLPLNGPRFIAPYWANNDLGGTGEVYYRQTRNFVLLARATNEIQRVFSLHQDVIITNLVIVTWNEVRFLKHYNSDKVCT